MLGKAYCEVNEYQPAALALREVGTIHCDINRMLHTLCYDGRVEHYMTYRIEGMQRYFICYAVKWI